MSKYPAWTAGTDITADLIAAGLTEYILADADQTVNNSTSFVTSTEITAELAANSIYEVEMYLYFSPGGATADFKTDWTVPSGATGLRWCVGVSSTVSQADTLGDGRFAAHGFTTAVTYGNRGANNNQVGALERAIVTTTNAGTIALRFAQGTLEAVDTVLQDLSTMKITRIA